MFSRLRVDVIDDDHLFREALVSAIENDPRFSCRKHSDPVGPPDVVVVSAHSPAAHLRETLARVREDVPGARIVAVVGYLDDALADALVAAGAHAAVCSSTGLEALLDVLDGQAGIDRLLVTPHARDDLAVRSARATGLTPRQYQVLRLLGSGLSATQIAQELAISLVTARDHIKAIHREMDCRSTTQAVVMAARRGMLPELSRPLF